MSTPTTSTEQITATLRRLADAWNAGDGAAYGAEFTADATYVTFAGDVLRGPAIGEVHQFLFDGPLRGSRMGDPSAAAEIRLVRDDVAHVLVDGGVTLEGQEEVPDDRASTITFLLERADGRWAVAAFQNTRRPGGAG